MIEATDDVAGVPEETPLFEQDRPQRLRLIEAILFASAAPVASSDIALRLPDDADVDELLHELSESYQGRGVVLRQCGGGWAFRTAADLAPMLSGEAPVTRRLSRAAVETLAIIAYHQPVTRAEIEDIRGVGVSKGTIDILLEAAWVKPLGRRRSPGRPLTWGVTETFFDHFGLTSRDDLPGLDELRHSGLMDSQSILSDGADGLPDLFREDQEEEDEPDRDGWTDDDFADVLIDEIDDLTDETEAA